MQRKARCTDSSAKRTYEHYTVFVKKCQVLMSETTYCVFVSGNLD